jgi:hypothetical protein
VAVGLMTLALGAGGALGQGVPGGPDLPPPAAVPDPPPAAPAPAPAPAPSPAPAPAPEPVAPAPAPEPEVEAPSGPSEEELEQQRLEEERRARAEAARRAREAERRRQEALRRERRERAEEFRRVQAYAAASTAISGGLDRASAALDRAAVTAGVAAPVEEATDPAESPSRGTALLYMLLGASGLSAALVVLPFGLRRGGAAEPGDLSPPGSVSRVVAYVEAHLPVVERHRVELAGVSAACLLIALLIVLGLV